MAELSTQRYDSVNKSERRRVKAGRAICAILCIFMLSAVLLTLLPVNASASQEASADPEAAVTAIVPGSSEEPVATGETAADPSAGPETTADPEPTGSQSSSGRYFITKTHIIISCIVAFSIAVIIAVVQANKKFKN